jgi:large subunit ribosomal protein L9
MKIILTEDVVGLGDIGEAVVVRSGYARNFLIPRGFAIETETSSAKAVAHKMRQIDAKKRRMKKDAEERATSLSNISIELELRVGSGGKVFGSISAKQIADKLVELGHDIDRRRVLLVEPIRKIGQRKVRIKLHAEVITEIDVVTKAISATSSEEEQETREARQNINLVSEQREQEEDETLQ